LGKVKSLTSLNANGRSRLDFKEANSIEISNKKDQLELIISDNTTLLRRHLKYVFDIDISLSRVHARLTARILLKQLRCFKSFLGQLFCSFQNSERSEVSRT